MFTWTRAMMLRKVQFGIARVEVGSGQCVDLLGRLATREQMEEISFGGKSHCLITALLVY